jgi:hypothetical protein
MKKNLACLLLPLVIASFGQAQTPPTADQCLDIMHKLEPTLPGLIQSAKTQITSMIPDPPGYEKKLPARDKVVSTKDVDNLKEYGGLSEAYLFSDKTDKAEELRSWFTQSAKTVFPPDETFTASVNGDFGIYYFDKKDFKKAEPLLLSSMNQFEAHLTPAIYNNLLSDYICMALIRDKQGKKDDAVSYMRKLADLSAKQQQPAK